MAKLGINIDHVATVREARKTNEPDPVWAATLAELGGADGITFHLREDRRHIQDRDVRVLKETVPLPLNFELACADDVLKIACDMQPHQATLVPESREEVTTEGGLDVVGNRLKIQESIKRLQAAGILVSLFLDPDIKQIDAAKEIAADAVELHTGPFAHASGTQREPAALHTLHEAAEAILERKMTLHAGHGLTFRNVKPVAAIASMCELNIGHSIVARAVMVGMEQAVRDMKRLIWEACQGS